MAMSGISRSQISRLCAEIDEREQTILQRPIGGDWPYLWLDATHLKVREAGRIVPMAAIIAIGARCWACRSCPHRSQPHRPRS